MIKYQRVTPDFVIEKLLNGIYISSDQKILEPSSGEGKIIDFLCKNTIQEKLNITLVELNQEKLEKSKYLREEYPEHRFSFYHSDFLQWGKSCGELFNSIIACPPFKNQIDLEHIKAMYGLLDNRTSTAVMTTLTGVGWVTNNFTDSIEFREWLSTKDYNFKLLPDNTFIEKYKNVPTGILTILKHEETYF